MSKPKASPNYEYDPVRDPLGKGCPFVRAACPGDRCAFYDNHTNTCVLGHYRPYISKKPDK